MKEDAVLDFKAAVAVIQQAERWHVHSHYTWEALEDFHYQLLPPEEQEQIADHLVLCEECRNLLLHGVIEAADFSPAPSIEEAWSQFCLRLHLEFPDSASPEHLSLEGQIEQLYDQILARIEASPAGGQDEEIGRVYSRLRELQAAEAAKFRQQFTASLNMPIDAGETILARARALREQLEDSTPRDPAARDTDVP